LIEDLDGLAAALGAARHGLLKTAGLGYMGAD
jgi:hypothetical protein